MIVILSEHLIRTLNSKLACGAQASLQHAGIWTRDKQGLENGRSSQLIRGHFFSDDTWCSVLNKEIHAGEADNIDEYSGSCTDCIFQTIWFVSFVGFSFFFQASFHYTLKWRKSKGKRSNSK
jgi:hypothetical protein